METGAEETAFVITVDGVEAASFAGLETGGEHVTEAGKSCLVAGALPGRNYEVGITLAIFDVGGYGLLYLDVFALAEGGPAGDDEVGRGWFAVYAQGGWIEDSPAGGQFAVPPHNERLEIGGHAGDVRGVEEFFGVAAEASDIVAHLHEGVARHCCAGGFGGRQSVPHRLEFCAGAEVFLRFQALPDHGEIAGAQLVFGGDSGEGCVWLAQAYAMTVAPGGLKVISEIGGLAVIEADDALDRVAFPVGFHQHGEGCKIEAIWFENQVVCDSPCGVEILRHQAGGDCQGFSGVVEACLVGGVYGEFAGGAEVDAGQVANRIVVLGIAEAAVQDGAGVTGVGADLAGTHRVQPGGDLALRFRGGLGCLLRWHLIGVEA